MIRKLLNTIQRYCFCKRIFVVITCSEDWQPGIFVIGFEHHGIHAMTKNEVA
jgi:hypothetical protein